VRRGRLALVGTAVVLTALAAGCTGDSSSGASSTPGPSSGAPSDTAVPTDGVPGEVTFTMATVGEPKNPSVGVVQTFGGPKGNFVDLPEGTGIYPTCKDAPKAPPSCLTVGSVGYTYGIAELETTVTQYVAFLNTADPGGRNAHQLYFDEMNPTTWPQYGSIAFDATAGVGKHYSVAFPEWADKPFAFGDFSRASRFVNSMNNGKVLSKTSSTSNGFTYVTYKVRLSPQTESGMYDVNDEQTKRSESTGFVIPSNDEWVKAAYYDPKGGGTHSYWAYPTGPFNPPNVSVLNPTNGNVTNASDQPLSTYNPNDPNSTHDTPGSPAGKAPTWCPPQVGSSCGDLPPSFPAGLDLEKNYEANVSTVGQTKTFSPWGTLDMGGNVVEILDTLAPQPVGYHFARDWHYYHGGVANAPAYQVEISAFGYFPGDTEFSKAYPWLGFRIGVIGSP